MRQIKFRGKRTDTDEMVYGDLIHGVGSKHGRIYILPVTNIYPKGCNDLDGWEVVPNTVGQFTGLLDKNGKEIYEGDLSQDKLGRISICEFHHGGYWIKTIETLCSERLHSDSQIDESTPKSIYCIISLIMSILPF